MPSNSDFKKLQTEWYAKLQSQGFEDIEDSEHNLINYERSHYNYGKTDGKSSDVIMAANDIKADYYRLANAFLLDHKFETHKDRLIWWYHTDGLSAAKIADIFAELEVPATGTVTVKRTIRRLKNLLIKQKGTENGRSE